MAIDRGGKFNIYRMKKTFLSILLLITLCLNSFSKANISKINSETVTTTIAQKQSQNLTAISLFSVTYLPVSCGFILVYGDISMFDAIALQAYVERTYCNPPRF